MGYLKAAGYDPEGLLDLFSKLAYEHPAWAQAIDSEDLLNQRSAIEGEEPPPGGLATRHCQPIMAIKVVARPFNEWYASASGGGRQCFRYSANLWYSLVRSLGIETFVR
jgi:hypothetical protein